jgi:D-glycero-D-manno-heptose 1,7-bisphosphate phosphatase
VLASVRSEVKLVILDRDGVINYDSKQFIKSPAEWRPIPGSLEAIARLNQAGYRVVVATNQSGLGRGLFDMDTLNAIHDKMHRAVLGCRWTHRRDLLLSAHDRCRCNCRKPKTGMFERIAKCFNIDLEARTGRSAIPCATCRPPSRSARRRCWC